MEKEFQQILLKIKGIFSGKKIGHSAYKATQSWLWIVFFTGSVAFVLCGIGVYNFFFENKMENIEENTQYASSTPFTSTRIEKIVEEYRGQVFRFNETRKTPPEIPSTGRMTTKAVEDTAFSDNVRREDGERSTVPRVD